MRIKRDKSQLLIIDMQDILLNLMEDREQLIERTLRLAKAAERLSIPTLISEQNPEKLGATNSQINDAAAPETPVISKLEFSCLANETLLERLKSNFKNGLSQVVICGVEAHICVTQTVMDLKEHGFDPFVAADAVASREDDSWDLALDRMARCAAEIIDSEMVLYEWLERAGTPEFRDLLPLIKQ